MKKDLDLLIISGLENRKTLLQMLSGLSINVFNVSTIGQAQELLARKDIGVVFCEERLPDGTFRDLLHLQSAKTRITSWVVMLTTGEWAEYLDALGLGAADAVRCPLQSTDVEMALICATRKQREFEAPLGLSA
jgi:DNA-binding NtrC family response regulator